ncbi:MAG: hypothetical protein K0R78_308 [Pelosinus sp.]|nr:hypothetical protein [Pelosinus sp.]
METSKLLLESDRTALSMGVFSLSLLGIVILILSIFR